MGTHAERPSKRVIEKRIRNRVIEYLELAASFDEQQRYERDVPIAYVPGEVIDSWGDNFPGGFERDLPRFSVFSADEVAALRRVELANDAAAREMGRRFPRLEEVQALPAWGALRDAAAVALPVFKRRGRLSEDEEVP